MANDSVGQMFSPAISPDGRTVAVLWNQKQTGVWLISLSDFSQRILRPGWLLPVGWSADGNSVSVWKADSLLIVPIDQPNRGRAILLPWKNADCVPLERPSGLKLACRVTEQVSDVWKVKNFDWEHRPQ